MYISILDGQMCTTAYDWVRRVFGLRRDLAVSAEDPTPIHTSYWKTDSDPLVAISVQVDNYLKYKYNSHILRSFDKFYAMDLKL